MEYAKYIKNIQELIAEDFLGIDRLYYGAEFCEQLIPAWKDIEKALVFCNVNDIGFTFVTPYVTDKGMDKLFVLIDKIMTKVSLEKKQLEIVINDYGVLFALETNKSISKIAGRLLAKQKSGPRFIIEKKNMPESRQHLVGLSAFSANFVEHLLSLGIYRIELNNIIQGISDDFSALNVSKSLYTPYVFVSTTSPRFCIFNNNRESVCGWECKQFDFFQLKNKDMPLPLLLKGNTQFYKNERIPENIEEKGFDRLIYEM